MRGGWAAVGGKTQLACALAAVALLGGGRPRAAVADPPASPCFGRTTPPPGDVFRFVNGAEPEALDPALLSGQSDGRIAQALFEGLVVQHPRTLEPVPGVAQAWDLSPDGRTYTFHLRPVARWSDGTRVTAFDFEWSWRRVLHPDTPSRYADLFYLLRNGRAYKKREITDAALVGLRARDDSTLVVELEEPTPYFLQLLTSYAFLPVPRRVVERWGDRWTRPEHIVGNGAFVLAEHRPNDRLVLRRNPRYWDAAEVRLAKVIAYCSEDLATALNMYRAGMTDWNPSGYVPAEYVPYVQRYADFRSGPFLATCFYSFNVTRAPFDDVRVRRALALAVDRQRITRYLLHGSKVPWGNVVAPGFTAYPYPTGAGHDPAAARRLLAEAGYAGGRNFPPAEILFNTSQDQRKIAEAIQAMWKQELGIEVRLANQEFGSYMRATTSLQYQIARRSWIADYNDPSTFLFVLRRGDGNNRTGWGSARFDSLLAEASRTLEPAERAGLLAAAERLVLDEMPFMPIYAYETVELVAPYVRGWYPTPMDVHPLKDIWIERAGRPAGSAAEEAAR